jgi:manganese-dependent inorganic pyrophosphatase
MPQNNILIGETIYIVGHKNPDVDSIVSAYAYQIYRHSQGDFNYIAIRCGQPNQPTKWLFEKFKLQIPPLVEDVSNMKIALVDHTEPSIRPNGWKNAKIVEVVDHHKLTLETAEPSKITIRPYGATATLVGQKMLRQKLPLKPEIAGLLLGAIIDDTLALRSPVTTQTDKEIAGELSTISGIGDLSEFARELFNKKDSWSKLKPKEIILQDYKEYQIGQSTISISQVETMDNQKLLKFSDDLLSELNKMNIENPLNYRFIMLTDLLRNDCILLCLVQNQSAIETIFKKTMEDGYKIHLPGVLSRKKQILPALIENTNLLSVSNL